MQPPTPESPDSAPPGPGRGWRGRWRGRYVPVSRRGPPGAVSKGRELSVFAERHGCRILISILFIYTVREQTTIDGRNYLYHRTGRSTESACDSETRHSTLYNQHVQAAGTCIYQHVTRQSPVVARAPGHRDQRTCQPGRRPAPQTPGPQTPTACQGAPSARTIGGGRWSRLSRAASACCFLGL